MPVRDVVDVSKLRGSVVHYSIPALEMTGAPTEEDVSAIDSAKLCVREGDVLISKLNPRKSRVVRIADHGKALVLASTEFVAFRPGGQCDGKFLSYFLQSHEVTSALASQVTSVTRSHQRVDPAVIAGLEVPPLQIEAQIRLAAYLERETAEIDVFITDQQELIALLTERRAATISHAVTKGLNPSVPMKESGVAWFGEIPASWDVGHLKRFAERITDGAHISPETDGGVYPFVSTRDIRNGQIDLSNSLRTSPATYDYMVRSGCQPRPGDVLFSKDGTVGRTAVVGPSEPFVVASSLIIISPRWLIDSRFLNFMLKGQPLQEQIASFVKGAGLPRLSIANLERIVGLLPPAVEQRNIADYLDRETVEIDATIADAREAIALSWERRAALISAAVTGKIDVRGMA